MNAIWLILGSFLFGFSAWLGRVFAETLLLKCLTAKLAKRQKKAINELNAAIASAKDALDKKGSPIVILADHAKNKDKN